MNAQEIDEKIMASDTPAYDPRFSGFMTPAEYQSYPTNWGHTYYTYLSRAMSVLQPKNVVELGTSIGRSGAFIMSQLPAGSRFTTVEISNEPRVDLSAFVGDPRLTMLYGSTTSPEVFAQVPDNIDFMFVDTDHTFAQVSAEWFLYQSKLASGAVVLFDDIHLNPEMDMFWSQLPAELKLDLRRDLHFSGFGMLVWP